MVFIVRKPNHNDGESDGSECGCCGVCCFVFLEVVADKEAKAHQASRLCTSFIQHCAFVGRTEVGTAATRRAGVARRCLYST